MADSGTTRRHRTGEDYLFVAYAHEDLEAVEPELDRISRTLPIWYDADIRGGEPWSEELALAILNCCGFIFFVTPRSIASPHCLRELHFAIDEAKTIIPIHLAPTSLPHGIRLAIGDRQAILQYAMSREAYEQKLAYALASLVSRDPQGTARGMLADGLVRDKPSLAVLPFDHQAPDSPTAQLAGDTSQDIAMLLARVPEFFVVSYHSASRAAARTTDPQALAYSLGVRYLITGNVRASARRLRVSAQLVDALTGATLWANSFEREIGSVFELQDELARAIAGQLHPELVIADLNYARTSQNYTAWRLIADAMRKYGHSPTPDVGPELVALVEEALLADPNYAPAHALYAFTVAHRRNWGEVSQEEIERAQIYARKALEIAPNDPLVLYFIGSVEQALGRRRIGERLALKAAEREPSNAAFQATAGFILTLGGNTDEGVRRLQIAEQLSPNDPLRGSYLFQLGSAYFNARRFEEALEALTESVVTQPDSFWAWLVIAGAAVQLRDEAQTTAAIRRIQSLTELRAPQFELLLARILEDAWHDGSPIRELWQDTLARLDAAGL